MWAKTHNSILALTARTICMRIVILPIWFSLKSLEEIDEKLRILNQVERHGNYNKLNCELHPMAYWQGDICHDVLLTEMGDER